MSEHHTGRYYCSYRSPAGWSENSDPLELVMTGAYSQPSLSALPSPAVTSGGNVTLQCGSWQGFNSLQRTGASFLGLKCPTEKPVLSAWPSSTVTQGEHVEIKCHSHFGSDTFWLHKENGALVPEIQDRMFQNSFILGPVTPAHAGTYRCSKGVVPSAFSDPLDIVITGLYGQPSLAAQPGPMVKSGGKVTLQCGSEIMFETFILILEREGISRGMLRLSGKPGEGASQASVTVDPMTPSNSGTYSCYGCHSHQPYEWSAPSHPLELVVTGESAPTCLRPLWDADQMSEDWGALGGGVKGGDLYKKPSLSAQVGSVVWPGENVTLSCSSESPFGLFYVVKDKETDGLRLPAAQGHNGRFQADFLLGPVTHGGTYRCYGMYSTFCHEWSTPSDPLHLCVTGNSSSSCPSPPEPGLRTSE
ncbi:killer cell immunoglobulin-like receptor 3DL3 [Ctenodactylus gundi]